MKQDRIIAILAYASGILFFKVFFEKYIYIKIILTIVWLVFGERLFMCTNYLLFLNLLHKKLENFNSNE